MKIGLAVSSAWILALAVPDQVDAQVFDMGGLTGTLSQDHVTQRERARARASSRSPKAAAARTAQTCARLPEFRSRHGGGDFRVQQLTRLCRQAGY